MPTSLVERAPRGGREPPGQARDVRRRHARDQRRDRGTTQGSPSGTTGGSESTSDRRPVQRCSATRHHGRIVVIPTRAISGAPAPHRTEAAGQRAPRTREPSATLGLPRQNRSSERRSSDECRSADRPQAMRSAKSGRRTIRPPARLRFRSARRVRAWRRFLRRCRCCRTAGRSPALAGAVRPWFHRRVTAGTH